MVILIENYISILQLQADRDALRCHRGTSRKLGTRSQNRLRLAGRNTTDPTTSNREIYSETHHHITSGERIKDA